MKLMKVAAAVGFATLLAGFTAVDRSSDVGVKIIPESPIVFDSSLTFVNNAGHDVTVVGPWTRFQVEMTVPTSVGSPVTVVSVNAQAASTGSSLVTDFVPESDNYTADHSTPCDYTSYGTFEPNGNPAMLHESDEGGTGFCRTSNQILYVSLPSEFSSANKATRAIMITPEGWFGTLTTPVSRFMKSVTATLQ